MSDPDASPEVSHEDHYEEQIDIGSDDPEDMGDEADGEGEGEPDEEKMEGQEGLDLDMAEEDNIAFPDDPDGEHETGIENGDMVRPEAFIDETKRDNVEEGLTEEEAEQVEEKKMEERGREDVEGLLSQPPHGSEVFVGGISREITEDDLRELCSSCGDIFELRILRDKDTGENKGYAFVMFTSKENADRAIETLNDSELKGKKIRFSQSQSKSRLFIGNIPKNWDKADLEKHLQEQGPGIENIELLKDSQNPARNRGFAFVDYYNHACAEYSRKNIAAQNFKLGSNALTVSWAEIRGSTDSAALSQVKVVYVRNLPDGVTQEQLQKLFDHHGEINKVVLPASRPGQPKRDYGFIHFSDRSSALKAIEKTETYELEGRVLEASLAKPPSERKPSDHAYPYQRSGLLLQPQSRFDFGYPADPYGGYGGRGNYQPVIYGRGPAPAGMAMVPMMLPDGRLGYVLQEPGVQGGSAPYRTGRTSHGSGASRQTGGGGTSSGNSRRYRPY